MLVPVEYHTGVRAIIACLFVAVALAIVAYRSCGAGSHLDVDPNARREIERAKQR
jgi:hypothetical protein